MMPYSRVQLQARAGLLQGLGALVVVGFALHFSTCVVGPTTQDNQCAQRQEPSHTTASCIDVNESRLVCASQSGRQWLEAYPVMDVQDAHAQLDKAEHDIILRQQLPFPVTQGLLQITLLRISTLLRPGP